MLQNLLLPLLEYTQVVKEAYTPFLAQGEQSSSLEVRMMRQPSSAAGAEPRLVVAAPAVDKEEEQVCCRFSYLGPL